MMEPAAIVEYVNSLPPSQRLKYYRLTKGERFTLEAMLNCSKGTGNRVFAKKEKLAELAGVNKKTVHNAIHGYKGKDGAEHDGLLARRILTQTAPGDRGDRRAATYKVNWQNFVVDPRQFRALERRLRQSQQRTLPGMDADHDEDAGASLPPFQQPRTGFPQITGAIVAPLRGNSCPSEGKRLPLRGETVAPVVEKLVVNSSSQNQQNRFSPAGEERIEEIIARSHQTSVCSSLKAEAKTGKPWSSTPWSSQKKTSWDTMHAGIRQRIQKNLDLIREAALGKSYPLSAHEYAREKAGEMRLACERAVIWTHVTEDLVQEVYDRVIASRMPKGDA